VTCRLSVEVKATILFQLPGPIVACCVVVAVVSVSNNLGSFSSRVKSRSVWENLDRGREHRPNAVRSVHMTEVNKMFIIWQRRKL